VGGGLRRCRRPKGNAAVAYVLQEHPLDLSWIKLSELLPDHVVGTGTSSQGLHPQRGTKGWSKHRFGSAKPRGTSRVAAAARPPLSHWSHLRQVRPQRVPGSNKQVSNRSAPKALSYEPEANLSRRVGAAGAVERLPQLADLALGRRRAARRWFAGYKGAAQRVNLSPHDPSRGEVLHLHCGALTRILQPSTWSCIRFSTCLVSKHDFCLERRADGEGRGASARDLNTGVAARGTRARLRAASWGQRPPALRVGAVERMDESLHRQGGLAPTGARAARAA